MPLVRRCVLLDLPGREPSTFSDAEYRALLEALQRSPPRNRSRDLALAHVLCHCKLSIDTSVGLDIGQLHLEKGVFLDVVLPRARAPREVRFNHLVREALELWVLHRRSRIRGNGSSALFLWDYDARLPAEVARDQSGRGGWLPSRRRRRRAHLAGKLVVELQFGGWLPGRRRMPARPSAPACS
jgi:hypothetical protein